MPNPDGPMTDAELQRMHGVGNRAEFEAKLAAEAALPPEATIEELLLQVVSSLERIEGLLRNPGVKTESSRESSSGG